MTVRGIGGHSGAPARGVNAITVMARVIDRKATFALNLVPEMKDWPRLEEAEQTLRFHAQEILALSKMNWNNTQFDGFEPITIRAARQVGKILKYVGERDHMQPHYSFYM